MAFLDKAEGIDPLPAQPGATVSLFKPTEEQFAIVSAAVETKDNLLVEALAGAAKTSTLVLLASSPQMMVIPTLCLAFNKKIAEEMKLRLPQNCLAKTLNSVGHSAWGRFIGKRLDLDTKKNYNILSGVFKQLEKRQSKAYMEDLREQFADILKMIAHAKGSGWVPARCQQRNTGLMDDAEYFANLDEELPTDIQDILDSCVLESISQAFAGKIDFDDQIYMSTCFGARFDSFPLVMIDEAQDLSSLNHQMLELIVAGERLIAVGDPNQAIYGFRGAHADSMQLLQERFHMRTLQLTTSFRCPIAVVNEAHWRAPHMKAPSWAKPGLVRTWGDWTVSQLPPDAVIICRNNAPLFSMAIRLLMEGRFPELVGNDIGKNLLKAMEKLGPKELDYESALGALETYKMRRLSKARDHAKAAVEDFCLCIRIFLDHAHSTLGAGIEYANHLMSSTGPVKLMTGHKSKGLEFPSVFILDKQLLRLEGGGKNQDKNLLYVMQTRAQETLTYITSEQLIMTEGKPEDVK